MPNFLAVRLLPFGIVSHIFPDELWKRPERPLPPSTQEYYLFGDQKLSIKWDWVDTKQLCLVFDGVEVPCHKIILAAASPVFEAMVENKHREAIECKANIELTEEVGQGFVQFIYTGDLPEGLLKEHAAAFLSLGEMFDMQELKDLAEVELLSHLDKENMVAMISIGGLFRADGIHEAALKMTKANMPWLRSQVSNK